MKYKKEKKRIAVDLDGTLTKRGLFHNCMNLTPNQLNEIYKKAKPDLKMIELINRLNRYYVIYIFTSRNNLHQKVTEEWLKKYNVKYDYFIVDKPYYDVIIDDKAITPKEFKHRFNKNNYGTN